MEGNERGGKGKGRGGFPPIRESGSASGGTVRKIYGGIDGAWPVKAPNMTYEKHRGRECGGRPPLWKTGKLLCKYELNRLPATLHRPHVRC